MRFFSVAFLTSLRRQFTGWRTWLLLLLAPLVSFGAARLLPPEETSAPVRVGVVLPEEGGGPFWEKLSARSGLVVTFLPASCEEAERQVAAGQWDCALVLPEDFSARLAALDTAELFTLLTGPGSAVYPLVRETAAACAAECVSPGIAEQYLLDSGITAPARLEEVRPRLQEVLLDRERVLVTLETADGRPLDPLTLADRGVSNLISGLTASVLLVWTLFLAMDLGRWLESPAARRLAPLTGRTALLLPRLAGGLVPGLCAGGLALLAAEHPLTCIAALVPFLLFWGGAALLLARCRPAWSALPVLMPFVPALCLLLSPVLVDVSLIFPALAPAVRWMPVTLYLGACAGRWTDGLILLAGGALLLAAGIKKSPSERGRY